MGKGLKDQFKPGRHVRDRILVIRRYRNIGKPEIGKLKLREVEKVAFF